MSLKLFTCEMCGKTFSINSNLKRHIKTLHPSFDNIEVFKCHICNKTFNVRSNLNTHIKSVHSNSRFICEICGKGFNVHCNLDTHIKTIHAINESLRFTCTICGKTFNVRSNLNRHVKTIHLNNGCEIFTCEICAKSFNVRSNLEIHVKTIHSSDRFSCEVCAKTFQLRFKLDAHMKKNHTTNTERKKKIKCKLCDTVFNIMEFTKHFPEIHNIELKTQEFEFKTEYEFLEWKKVIEEQETASYIKTCGSSCSKMYQKIVYYKCHRSGYYRGKFDSFQRKRALKKQGSSKIDSYCPAKIKAMTCNNGSVKVLHCSTHVGHTMELAHLNIPLEDRKALASKITAKVPFDTIIEEVQTSGINIQRTHLIKKQDLRNIIRDFSISPDYISHKKTKKLSKKETENEASFLKTVNNDELPASTGIDLENTDISLETLKKKVSDECNLILSKVTNSKQIHALLTNFQNLKPVLDSSELSLGAMEILPADS